MGCSLQVKKILVFIRIIHNFTNNSRIICRSIMNTLYTILFLF
jgi:hypothetical protein